MTEPRKDDYERYRAAVREIREDHDHWIETVSARAYEYGVMAIKSVLYASGGALLAIPAISGITESFNLELAAISGISFAASVAFCVISIYLIHLNWLSHFHVASFERRKNIKFAFENLLPEQEWSGESDDVLSSKITYNNRVIKYTFYAPHVFGILAILSSGYGAFRLYQSVGF